MFLVVLALIAVIDAKTKTIPIWLNLILFLIGIVRIWYQCIFLHHTYLPEVISLFTSIMIMGGLVVIRKALRGGIGYGDMILTGVFVLGCGYRMGLYSLAVCYLFFLLFGVIAIIRGTGRETTFPFAPFLFAGYVVTLMMMKGELG